MFHVTPAAAEQILRAATAQQDAAATPPVQPKLRVAAKIEDDEIVYGMGFDEEREQDAVIDATGLTLLIAPPSQELLVGTTLDFVELRPGEFQFIFINPNEASACATRSGCGSCGNRSPGCA